MKRFVRSGIAVLLGMALAGGTSMAIASTGIPGQETVAQGHCSSTSDYELAMEPDLGVEMEVHIETGVAGQPWKVELRFDGRTFFRDVKQTEADGGFEIRAQLPNQPGPDRLTARLVNPATGETCEGSLTAPL